MKKDPLVFLKHIIASIEHIKNFTRRLSKQKFEVDIEKQYAVVRALEIIGEAAKNVPSDFAKKHKEVPWSEIARTRDKLIHHYFGVNLDRVWGIVKKDIPKLKKQIQDILKSLGEN